MFLKAILALWVSLMGLVPNLFADEKADFSSPQLKTRHLFTLQATVPDAQLVPNGPYGTRLYIPVLGGHFKGERLSGEVLPGGADSQLLRHDGVAELDVRVALKTDDGVIIYMNGVGMRHGPPEVLARIKNGEQVDKSEYYFRESMMFEAPPGRYEWLNRIIAVASGERTDKYVLIEFFEIL